MKFLNFPVLTKPLVIIGAFAVTSFLTYAVISSPGEMLVSTPYQTRNLTAEAEFSRLAGKNGMAVLDGIIAKIRAKAIAKGGDPFDAMAYDAYIDDRLSAIDALDDQIRSEIGIEYAFIFQYAYPRVLELKRNEEKVVSVLKRLGTVMNGDSSVSGDTSVSGNGGAAVPSNNSDFCKKEMKFGDLRICDTGKQAVYSEINSLCPAGFHVPNYWEMGTLLSSLAPIELEGNYYFIASLYRDTHNDPSYPFQNNPYVLKGKNSLNHTSSTYGVSGTEKWDVLCIVDGVLPTTDTNGVQSCVLEPGKYTGLNGKYDFAAKKRNFLFAGERISFAATWADVAKWNIDFQLNLDCDRAKDITASETIVKVNSCKYGYILQENDCVLDNAVCNLENLGNVHSVNSKVCSWKSVWTEKIVSTITTSRDLSKLIDLDRSRITDSFYVETVIEIKNSFVAAESEILEKYRNNYNKKIDIKLVCDEKKTDVTGSAKRYFENCSVDGLFWQ